MLYLSGKVRRERRESTTEYYVRYVSLAAHLKPSLTENDLVTALTSHFSMEIQRAMLAANLRSSQELLAFLGRMHSLENSQEVYKKSKQEQNSKDFERKQPKGCDQGGGRGYREMLGLCCTDTDKVTPEPRTGVTKPCDGATIRQIEGICDRHTNLIPRYHSFSRGTQTQGKGLNR